MLETRFKHITKHKEERLKYDMQWFIFEKLWAVRKCRKAVSQQFCISS